MSIDDEIKALLDQAKALKALGAAETKLEETKAAYKAKPTKEGKAAYRQASNELAAARAASRAGRPLGVGGDAVATVGDETFTQTVTEDEV